jgi:hypothetical protein
MDADVISKGTFRPTAFRTYHRCNYMLTVHQVVPVLPRIHWRARPDARYMIRNLPTSVYVPFQGYGRTRRQVESLSTCEFTQSNATTHRRRESAMMVRYRVIFLVWLLQCQAVPACKTTGLKYKTRWVMTIVTIL